MAVASTKILLADPDAAVVQALSPVLRARGYRIHVALDGSRALELAVLRRPDLVLFDESCRLLAASTFVEILRTNPRTEAIPVLLTGLHEPPSEPARRGREGYLRKPYNVDELIAGVDELLRAAAAQQVAVFEKEIQGQLSQISVADLLQVFAMNRRSGRLVLHLEGEQGELQVVDGRVHDARGPKVAGAKALFRYLPASKGAFEFHPSRSPIADRIGRSVDDILLEGMRQSDELVRILERLPTRATPLRLAIEPSALSSPDPITAELLGLFAAGSRSLGDLLDASTCTDLDAAQALAALLQRGYVEIEQGLRDPAEIPPLLTTAQLHGLRQRLSRERASSGRELVGKLLVASSELATLRRAAERLRGLPSFAAEHASHGIGTIGRLVLAPGLRIDLIALLAEDAMRPFWRPSAACAIGAALLELPAGASFTRFVTEELDLPVVSSPPEAPLDPARAVQQVLTEAATREPPGRVRT